MLLLFESNAQLHQRILRGGRVWLSSGAHCEQQINWKSYPSQADANVFRRYGDPCSLVLVESKLECSSARTDNGSYTYTWTIHIHRPSIGHIRLYNALKHGPDKKIRGTGPHSGRKCATQCTASPFVSTNPRHLVECPILLIFYHVLASTFHHYDRSMHVYGLISTYTKLRDLIATILWSVKSPDARVALAVAALKLRYK